MTRAATISAALTGKADLYAALRGLVADRGAGRRAKA